MMILNYKDKREELDEILYDMEVPRELFHQLAKLNDYVAFNRTYHNNAQKALDLIHEISPTPLLRHQINKGD